MRLFYLITATTILALVFSCTEDSTRPGDPIDSRWILRDNMTNIAILLLDYQTFVFEGGDLFYFLPCDKCGAAGLPFDVTFNPPGDFGDILFKYSASGDTIFFATIIWNGMGSIEYPEAFAPPDSFDVLSIDVPSPPSPEHFIYMIDIHPDSLDAWTHRAWSEINSLDIVYSFARKGSFRVGYYVYTPRVGAFDPSAAKWIVFLFLGSS